MAMKCLQLSTRCSDNGTARQVESGEGRLEVGTILRKKLAFPRPPITSPIMAEKKAYVRLSDLPYREPYLNEQQRSHVERQQ
jgi:hypothetical protein